MTKVHVALSRTLYGPSPWTPSYYSFWILEGSKEEVLPDPIKFSFRGSFYYSPRLFVVTCNGLASSAFYFVPLQAQPRLFVLSSPDGPNRLASLFVPNGALLNRGRESTNYLGFVLVLLCTEQFYAESW